MAIVIASAFLFAWVRATGTIPLIGYAWHALIDAPESPGSWGVALAGSYALTRAFGPTIRSRAARRLSWTLAAASLIVTAYLAWGMYRTTYQLEWLGRGFPHPDPAIITLERWYDARNPLRTPGSLKLHGEFPRVRFAIGLATVVLLALDGLILGMLAIPSDESAATGNTTSS